MDDFEVNEHEGRENHNFVQVSREYLKDWRSLMRKSPLSSEILLYFVEHMGRTTNAVVCSYTTLEEVTGMSRRTIARAIKILKDDKWIEPIKIGNATAYGVNARVFWQAARNQKKYAVFHATVIASATEQDNIEAKQPLRHIPFVGKTERPVLNCDERLPPPDQQDMDLN